MSGGGAHNLFLMNRLRELAGDMKVLTSADLGIDIDAKEAMCFAFLVHRTLTGQTGNVPSVTGARQAVRIGSVASA